jgi:Uma2 family endonuclease
LSTALRISIDECDELIAHGVFDADHVRIELVRGELVEMAPKSIAHEDLNDRLNDWSFDAAPRDRFRIRNQHTVGFSESQSVLMPDLAHVRPRSYWSERPQANDVFLIVEIADASLEYDRGEKADLFAAGDIADYWLVNLVDRWIEVRRDPGPDGYESVTTHPIGDRISPLAFPAIELEVASLFEWPAD